MGYQLGLEGGFPALRHGNATTLDELNAHLKVRQARLGHVDPETTMGYTHLVSEMIGVSRRNQVR